MRKRKKQNKKHRRNNAAKNKQKTKPTVKSTINGFQTPKKCVLFYTTLHNFKIGH